MAAAACSARIWKRLRGSRWTAPLRRAIARRFELLGLSRSERRILGLVAPFTMVHPIGVRFTIDAALSAIRSDLRGAFVECGVWKGGCSLAVLLAQRAAFGRVVRPIYLLDSFAGLPPVTGRDGPLAASWQRGATPEENCLASETALHAVFRGFGFGGADYRVIRGWFDETAPKVALDLADTGIALLRLDGDWYESTKACLEALIPITHDGAAVIIDDYYAWDGCARAVHDYLSAHDVPYRLRSMRRDYAAYFVKLPYQAPALMTADQR